MHFLHGGVLLSESEKGMLNKIFKKAVRYGYTDTTLELASLQSDIERKLFEKIK